MVCDFYILLWHILIIGVFKALYIHMPYVHFWILGVNDASCSAEVMERKGLHNAHPDVDMQLRSSVAGNMSSDHQFGKHVSHAMV